MNWQQLAGPAVVLLLGAACSGGDAEEGASSSTSAAPGREHASTTTTTQSDEVTTSSTPDSPNLTIPSSLAFASTDDIGRIFEVNATGFTVSAYETTSVAGDSISLEDGELVQATSAREVDGVLWVSVASVTGDRTSLGWLTADDLRPTAQSIRDDDPTVVGQFRRVAATLPDDQLGVYSSPGALGPVLGTLSESEIAMHGGGSALAPSGVRWLDVIDLNTRVRIGWVEARPFSTLRSIEATVGGGVDVDRRADRDITYGQDLPTGSVSAVGCNATQISFATGSAAGNAIVFGTTVPTGRLLRGTDSVYQWSASNGSTVFVDPGDTVTFTLPSESGQTWFFAALDESLEAASEMTGAGEPVVDPNGRVVSTESQTFVVPAGSCVYVAPDEENPSIDPYLLDLPPDERDAALAALEEAENQAALEAENQAAQEAENEETETTIPPE
jgi:hypothetical protein